MKKVLFFIMGAILSIAPVSVLAAESFEISGWIPYWRSVEGVQSITPHLAGFTEVNPFVYRVGKDGTLSNDSPLSQPEWVTLRAQAKAAGVRFVPTLMWSDADAIDETLKDPGRRAAHIQNITREVYAYNLDGVDIDYEAKHARTRVYFSQFLKELYDAIGYNKWVMCTIEARTPLDSRYSSPEAIPADIEYANDFSEINKYCDRVHIMAYDQGRIDLKLNEARPHPYAPIADPLWVEKVIQLAAAEISPDKLVIGVPTYGYEYDMFPAADGSGDTDYALLWSFNPNYATGITTKLGLAPARSPAGEWFITFPASQSSESKPLPHATRVLSWSDAEAVRQKAELAKTLGLRGIAIFKIDGGQDPALLSMLPAYKGAGSSAKTPNLSLTKEEAAGGGVPVPASVSPTSTGTFPVPTRNLSPGITGEDVRVLQKLLNKHGFMIAASGAGSPGNETAFFGNATYNALIKFQQAKKISPAIGHFGPKTRAVMQAL